MRRESRGHTARIQRPYGQTPRVRRGHTARHRGHARAPVPHGHARATDWLNPAGGLTEPTGPDNIHVTESPGTLPPRRARRVRSVKVPRPSSTTAARQNIHTSKSLYGLFRHNPDEHSRLQIAGVHAHEYDPAHCQASAAESFRAQPETAKIPKRIPPAVA